MKIIDPYEEEIESEIDEIKDESFRLALGKGLFWLVGNENKVHIEIFKMACFRDGVTEEEVATGKCETNNISHKKAWEKLKKDTITTGKPYNYFPRGRVKIKKGIATIYVSPVLYDEDFISEIVKSYGLNTDNGITRIKVKPILRYRYLMKI